MKGFAMIELMAIVPIIAAFLLIVFQFAGLFDQAVHDIAMANSEASRILNDWNAAHAAKGFERPCIEKINPHFIRYGGEPVQIGAGLWKEIISSPQEVCFVKEPVCISE